MNNFTADTKMKTWLLFICLFLIVLLCVVQSDDNTNQTNPVFSPVYAIKEVDIDESHYAISAYCTDSVKFNALNEFILAAEQSNISVCVFVTMDFVKLNYESLKEISKNHELGLLITKDLSSSSKNEIMRYLAKCNEAVYDKCGLLPKYVKYTGENASPVCEVALAFGQYCVEGVRGSVSSGTVLDLGEIDSTTPTILLNTVAAGAGNGFIPVKLGELLYSVDCLADDKGVQYE